MSNWIIKWGIKRQLKKIQRWQISIWKDVHHHVIQELQLKQWDTTTHLLEQLTPRMWNNANSHLLMVGMQNNSHDGRYLDSFLQN